MTLRALAVVLLLATTAFAQPDRSGGVPLVTIFGTDGQPVSQGNIGSIYFDLTTEQLYCSENTGAWVPFCSAGSGGATATVGPTQTPAPTASPTPSGCWQSPYVCLAGRAGGQRVAGGVAPGEVLQLVPNAAVAPFQQVEVMENFFGNTSLHIGPTPAHPMVVPNGGPVPVAFGALSSVVAAGAPNIVVVHSDDGAAVFIASSNNGISNIILSSVNGAPGSIFGLLVCGTPEVPAACGAGAQVAQWIPWTVDADGAWVDLGGVLFTQEKDPVSGAVASGVSFHTHDITGCPGGPPCNDVNAIFMDSTGRISLGNVDDMPDGVVVSQGKYTDPNIPIGIERQWAEGDPSVATNIQTTDFHQWQNPQKTPLCRVDATGRIWKNAVGDLCEPATPMPTLGPADCCYNTDEVMCHTGSQDQCRTRAPGTVPAANTTPVYNAACATACETNTPTETPTETPTRTPSSTALPCDPCVATRTPTITATPSNTPGTNQALCWTGTDQGQCSSVVGITGACTCVPF